MTTRRPRACRAAVIRASISSSVSPRYRSGRGCRSEICSFSYAVRTGNIIAGDPILNYIYVQQIMLYLLIALLLAQAAPPPRQTRNVQPVYPREAIGSAIQGIVLVEITIDANGKVS